MKQHHSLFLLLYILTYAASFTAPKLDPLIVQPSQLIPYDETPKHLRHDHVISRSSSRLSPLPSSSSIEQKTTAPTPLRQPATIAPQIRDAPLVTPTDLAPLPPSYAAKSQKIYGPLNAPRNYIESLISYYPNERDRPLLINAIRQAAPFILNRNGLPVRPLTCFGILLGIDKEESPKPSAK